MDMLDCQGVHSMFLPISPVEEDRQEKLALLLPSPRVEGATRRELESPDIGTFLLVAYLILWYTNGRTFFEREMPGIK
jgi:hypothetical protein